MTGIFDMQIVENEKKMIKAQKRVIGREMVTHMAGWRAAPFIVTALLSLKYNV